MTLEKILPTHGGAFASFVLLRKETALKVGFFDEQLRLFEDYHYWLRLLYYGGKMGYLRKILGKRRLHSESLTYNQDVIIPHAIKALQKFEAILNPTGRQACLVRREIAFSQVTIGLEGGQAPTGGGRLPRGSGVLYQGPGCSRFKKSQIRAARAALGSAMDSLGNIPLDLRIG